MAGAGGSSDYVRDADGTELLRHDPTTATLYLPGEELTRTNATGAISGVRYYRFNGTEVAVRNAGVAFSPYWVMTDPHGSDQVAAMTTSSGVGPVIRRYLDPYGNPLGATSGGTWPDPHGFLDKPSVAASGTGAVTPVQDVGAREYEPGTGRFLQVDPILDPADPQSLNGYAYADNDPIGKSDPSGLRFACDSGYCDKSGTDMNPGGSGEGSDPCNGPGGQHGCGGGGSQSAGLAAGPGGGSTRPGTGTAVAQCTDRSCVKRVIYQACSAKWEDVCDPVLDLQQQIQLILSPMSTSGWGLVGLVATIAGIITLPEVLAGCTVVAEGCALAAAIATGDVSLINTIAVTLADAIAAGSITADGVAALNSAAETANGVDIQAGKFAQTSYSETFSKGGLFGGRSIDSVAGDLRSGALSPKDVPINVVVRDGTTLISNTRSAQALIRAGIPRGSWNVINRTGDPLYENLVTGQLTRNGLTSSGYDFPS
jgi:RHS repeat-associated protein